MYLIGVYHSLEKKVLEENKTFSIETKGNTVTIMLLSILNICSQEELSESEQKADKVDDAAEQRRQIIRNKIIAIGKLSRTFSLLRENSELITELKTMSNTSRLPTGALGLGAEGLRRGNALSDIVLCVENLPGFVYSYYHIRRS